MAFKQALNIPLKNSKKADIEIKKAVL